MARVPSQVYVKLSMLGYAVPGWTEDATKEALVRQLVLETIARFGAQRCMFASNWHGSGAMSNADGADSCEISMEALYRRFDSCAATLSAPTLNACALRRVRSAFACSSLRVPALLLLSVTRDGASADRTIVHRTVPQACGAWAGG